MPRRVIAVSGPIASGKTTLCSELATRFGLAVFKTRDLISVASPRVKKERVALQRAGNALDRETKGSWIAHAVARALDREQPEDDVIIDSVRIESQVEALRDTFGPRVVHVHLTAPVDVLAARYRERKASIKELPTYDDARRDKTERNVDLLATIADIVVETDRCSPIDVFVRVAARLGYYGKDLSRLVDVLVGGQFGSEGKGQVAAYLSREYDVLVRVGGPNAGHRVFGMPDPYTFHLLPSGTRDSTAHLVLGPGSVLNLERLQREITDCRIEADRLSIDPQAMVIDQRDIEAEKGLVAKIGSTGQGVGWATARKILRGSLRPPVRLACECTELRPYLRPALAIYEDAFAHGRRILLEGTQGTGLSIHHGYYPHVTSRDTTVAGCLSDAGIAPGRVRRVLMVCRTYPIRVESPGGGNHSGDMSNEIDWGIVAERSGVDHKELEVRERTSTTHRRRRVSEFDWGLLRRAASLNGPTDIALTFVDYISISNRKARRFEQLTEKTLQLIEEVERVAGAPVSLVATRFHSRSIVDRRLW
ncbi:MAG TPA: adenylosuccinate synthetase [Terriglobales bacterium]